MRAGELVCCASLKGEGPIISTGVGSGVDPITTVYEQLRIDFPTSSG